MVFYWKIGGEIIIAFFFSTIIKILKSTTLPDSLEKKMMLDFKNKVSQVT